MGDALADFLDHAADLAAGGEGAWGLELVLVLDDQHVGIVDPHRLDRDHRPAGARLGAGHIFQHQRLGAADFLAQQGLHRVLPRSLLQRGTLSDGHTARKTWDAS